jgi:hypothetical protein
MCLDTNVNSEAVSFVCHVMKKMGMSAEFHCPIEIYIDGHTYNATMGFYPIVGYEYEVIKVITKINIKGVRHTRRLQHQLETAGEIRIADRRYYVGFNGEFYPWGELNEMAHVCFDISFIEY